MRGFISDLSLCWITPGAKNLMTLSFSLGLGQVQNELTLMQLPGCYWVTVNRQEDARMLARQTLTLQQSTVLISSPQALPAPVPLSDAADLALFPLPDTPEALLNLSTDLSRTLTDKPRLLLFYSAFSCWEKITSEELNNWLKDLQVWLASRQSTMLIITYDAGVNALQNDLQTRYRHLEGLSHLEWQPDHWNYRIQWWCNKSGMLADRALRLELIQEYFTQINETEQDPPLIFIDEHLYLAQKEVLEGATPPSGAWTLFDDNSQLASRAQQASAATVIFNLHHNEQMVALAGEIHNLRRTRGSGLKIVVREMHTTLRNSDERLLLACGVNAIVPFNASLSRFLTLLESLQGQRYNRHVPADLGVLLKSMQPLQEKGFLPMAYFCRSVTHLIAHAALPLDAKGLLVALQPGAELNPEQALALCQPRRYGDVVTRVDDRLYLFLSSCRYGDLDTALKFIFQRPPEEMFSSRLVWFEDRQILSELHQMAATTPGEQHDSAPSAPLPPADAQQEEPLRLVPPEATPVTPPPHKDEPQ